MPNGVKKQASGQRFRGSIACRRACQHLPRIVRDSALGETYADSEGIFTIDKQRIGAARFDALFFRLQKLRGTFEILRFESDGIKPFSGMLDIASLGAVRRQRLPEFNHCIFANRDKRAFFLPCVIFLIQGL
jgi:hypothetical protein